MQPVLLSLATGIVAASLALIGNYALLTFQTRASVREERREFVRSLHDETVALAVDIDLFTRQLRADVVAGARPGTSDKIEEGWEGDLLRRVRKARYGHPDPDVREAIEAVEDVMWFYITAAAEPAEPTDFRPVRSQAHRGGVAFTMDDAMQELRRAVYAAPHRDVPEIRYDGRSVGPMTLRLTNEALEAAGTVRRQLLEQAHDERGPSAGLHEGEEVL